MSDPKQERPLPRIGHTRRLFVKGVAGGGAALLAGLGWSGGAEACDVPVDGTPWPSVDGWEHRTVMHFLNAIVPGDHGQPLFAGDGHPLESGGDSTAGAWSACALDVFYDPYYGVVGRRANLLATALDWTTRLKRHGWYFYRAGQAQQLEVVDALVRGPGGRDVARAAALAMSATLGAFRNRSVTDVTGWPGPNGGYYDDGRHPLWRWQQPERMTEDGNLP